MFNIPNILTAMNLISGVFAILLAAAGRLDLAPFVLFLAGFFDFLDGFVARKLNKQGELGKQLDSLADMVSFGVAPGVIMLFTIVVMIYPSDARWTDGYASFAHYSINNWFNSWCYGVPNSFDASIRYLPFFALVIPFFSLFRLAKFNLDNRQEDGFIGLPTPLNTMFFMFFPLATAATYNSWCIRPSQIPFIFDPYVMAVVCVLMSVLLVSELRLFSLKFKHFAWRGNEIRYLFLLISICLIFTLFVWSIPIIVFLQLILSFIENQLKKSKDEIQSGN